MRLPVLRWPFRRDSDTSGRATAGAGADRDDAAPSGSAPPSARAWASLPPIQRVVADAPLVSAPDAFVRDVPGVRGLPPILTPLGHEVSPLAPPGVVVAHPHAVPALTSHATLVPRPVQRRHAAEATSPADSAEPAADAPATSAIPVPVPAAPAAPPQPPLRRVQAIAPAAAARPAAQPLTRAPTAPAPVVPVAPRTPAPTTGTGMRTTAANRSTSPAELTLGGRRSAPPPAARSVPVPASGTSPVQSTPISVAGPSSASAGAGPSPASGSPARSAHLATPMPRRAGLGAPIAAPPPHATAPRSSAPFPASPAPSPVQRSRPGVDREAAEGRHALGTPRGSVPDATPTGPLSLRPTIQRHFPSDAPEPSADPGAGTPPVGLPVLPVARSADAGASAGPPADRADLPLASPRRQEPAGDRADHGDAHSARTRPTLGRRPLRPAVTAQREAESADPAPAIGVPAVPGFLPGFTGQPPAGSIPQLGAPGGAGYGVGPTGGAPTAVGAAAPVARPVPVSRTVPGSAAAGLVGRIPSWSGPVPAARSVASPAGHRAPAVAMPLNRQPAPSPAAPAEPTVSRSVVSAPPAPAAQASHPPESAGPVLAPTATPVVQRVDGSAPAAETPAASVPSDEELDALVKASFGRIRTRLRNELIHEREARGLTFDMV